MSTQIQITPASGITVGTTPITSGTDGRVLFQSGGVVQQDSLFVFNPTTKVFGVGVAAPNGIFNAVGGVSELRFSTGAGSTTPTLAVINTGGTGKAVALAAGTGGSVFAFDNSGFFGIVGESKATILSNSVGSGTIHFRVESGGNVGIGSSAALARLDVRAQGALSTDVALRVRNSANTRTNLQVDGTGQVRTRNNSFSGDLFLVSYVSDVGVERDSFRFSHYPQNSMGRAWTFDAGFNGNNEGLRIYNDLAGADQGVLSLRQNNLLVGYDAFIPTVADRKTIVLFNGVAPTASHADSVKFYSADIVAGNAAPHFRTENGNIIKLYQQSSAGILTVPQLVTVLQNLGLLS